ncbi:glycoside hydrolase, partial [Lojkania enalia]
ALRTSSGQIATHITSLYPNRDLGLLPDPYWWWISGSTIDGLITYFHATDDAQYNTLIANTIISQATSTNDFMTPHATGNDDQAWWALAAMSAAEYGIPSPAGAPTWLDLARNVFNEQKGRWDMSRCNGGIKWKIKEGDDGWHYKSTISNGLFFQLAARIARFANDADAQSWAEKAYDWTVSVGLIGENFNVYDGTDDAKETGCVDVNHNMWSYNVGVFLYGSAVMADITKDLKWVDRTKGLLSSINRNFVKDGALFEQICEGANNCNIDQESFKGPLARWMGASATIMPDVTPDIQITVGAAAMAVGKIWNG